MNRKQTIAAIRAIAPQLTVRFADGEYRVSIDPAAIRAAYPDESYRGAVAMAEGMAAYDSDGESALGNARHIWAAWQAEIAPKPETISETPAEFPTVAHAMAARERTETPANPVKVNLQRQAAAMADIADSENAATVAVKRIDATPTWAAIMPLLRAAVENGTATGKRIAWEELARMAALADERNKLAPALSALFIVGNEIAHCVGAPGTMARDELDSALAGAAALLCN